MERDPRSPAHDPRPEPTPARGAASGEAPPEDARAGGPGRLGPAELEDHALVRRAQAGDEQAFERLVRGHQARALRVARNLVPGEEDARDLVQEAFLRVFRHMARFDFQHAFSTWLYRIVTNLAIDHLRRRRPSFSTAASDDEGGEIDLPDPGAPTPAARLEQAETADEVRACLARLAPHFQSALVLRELEGLPCTEIAEIVGATHVTVRWRLHRGRKLFQEEWERRERVRAAGGETETDASELEAVDELRDRARAVRGADPLGDCDGPLS